MFKYNLVLGKTRYGLTTHGAYRNVKQLLPLLRKNHIFVASPEMCEYIKNYALDHYPEFEDALIWPSEWEFRSRQRTFVIGDDALARTTLNYENLDSVLITNWASYPLCEGLELSNKFYPHEGHLPKFAQGFQVFHKRR